MRHLAVLIACFLVSAASYAGAPKAFPEIDQEDASVSVVVATSVPGDSLPIPEECDQPNVICMRYPIWFNVTVLRQVFGTLSTKQFSVSTYTHYGQPDSDDASAPRLIMLLTHNNESIMPVYADARLARRKDGEYFIINYSPGPIHWLPCGVSDLQEPIVARDFPTRIDVPRDDYLVEQFPDLYARYQRKAVPLFGISVTNIQRFLEHNRPQAENFNCEGQDES